MRSRVGICFRHDKRSDSPPIGSAGRAVIALLAGGLVLAGLALAATIGARAEAPLTREEPTSLPTHGVAMHGAPLLPPNFDHFPYANPVAKKAAACASASQKPSTALIHSTSRRARPRKAWSAMSSRP